MSTWDISLGDLSLMDATYCVTGLDTSTPGRVRVTLYIDGPNEKALIDAVRALEQQVNDATRRSMPTSVAHWLMLSVQPEGSETVRYAVRRGTVTVPRTQVGGIQMSEGWIDGVLVDLECLDYTLGEAIEYEAQTVTGRQPWFEIEGIPGDEPALVEMRIADQSVGSVINRVLVGSRSGVERFTPVLPFVDDGESGTDDDNTFSGWAASGDAGEAWTTIGELLGESLADGGIDDIYARLSDSTEHLSPPGTPDLVVTGGITIRQSRQYQQSPTPSFPATLPGSTIIVTVTVQSNAAVSTPSGYTLAQSIAHNTSPGQRVAIFYRDNAPVTTQVTVPGLSGVFRIGIIEVQGLKSAGSLDKASSGTANSSTSISNTGIGTPTQGFNLVVSAASARLVSGSVSYFIQINLGVAPVFASQSGNTGATHAMRAGTRLWGSSSVGETFMAKRTGTDNLMTCHWAVAMALFMGELASAPSLPEGSYQLCVAAVDASDRVSGASEIVAATLTTTSAIFAEWLASSGPVDHYRVYLRSGSDPWEYYDTADDTPSIMISTTSSDGTEDPPNWTTIEQVDFRMQLALESGTTIDVTTPALTSHVANDQWEPVLMHRGPVPSAQEVFGPGDTGWLARIQAVSNAATPVAVDALMLMPADEQQLDVRFMPSNLATPREWVIGTTPAMRTYAWLRDLNTGHEAGRLHALGYCLMGPGDTTVVMLMTTAGGVWQIEDVEAEINLTVIPRYRWLAGGV